VLRFTGGLAPSVVIHAKAGTQARKWVPAFACMTAWIAVHGSDDSLIPVQVLELELVAGHLGNDWLGLGLATGTLDIGVRGEISASFDWWPCPSVVIPAKAGTQAATGSSLSRG
jgi:hypothetical protein